MKTQDRPGHRTTTSIVAITTILAATLPGCKKDNATHLTTPNEPVFQRGLQNRAIPEMVDPNTVRVLLSGSSRVETGAPADKFGFAMALPRATSPIQEIAYDKGQFREYSIQTESSGTAGLKAAGGSITGEGSVERYRLVYEWSRFSSVTSGAGDNKPALEQWTMPQVSAVDVGFAVRLLMELTITKTRATADIALGPANLEAAFALGAASISAKYDIVGTNATFLPSNTTTIENLEAYEKARQDFHDRAKQLEEILGKCGKLRPLPDTKAQTDSAASPAETTTSSAAEPSGPAADAPEDDTPRAVECRGLKLTPTVLAYESTGKGVGLALQELQRQQGECRAAREHVSGLRAAFDRLPLTRNQRTRRRRKALGAQIYDAQLRLENCQSAFVALTKPTVEKSPTPSPDQVGDALKTQGYPVPRGKLAP